MTDSHKFYCIILRLMQNGWTKGAWEKSWFLPLGPRFSHGQISTQLSQTSLAIAHSLTAAKTQYLHYLLTDPDIVHCIFVLQNMHASSYWQEFSKIMEILMRHAADSAPRIRLLGLNLVPDDGITASHWQRTNLIDWVIDWLIDWLIG